MSQQKKILVCVPISLLREVDQLLIAEKSNRSEFVREAMKHYIKEKRRIEIRKAMERGYLDMANINLDIAKECVLADDITIKRYEENLSECE